MSDFNGSYVANNSPSATVTGEVTVAAVIIIFFLFIVALIIYLRAKGYSGTIGAVRSLSRRSESDPNQPNQPKQALDPSVLSSLPVTVFRLEDFQEEGGLKCSVCLSELRDGEKARLLPKCRHRFHVECIDMWFMSNSTCPLCRNPVGKDSSIKSSSENTVQPLEVVSDSGNSAESQNSTAKLDEGSSSLGGSFSEKRQEGMLVIEIPRRAVEGLSSTLSTPLTSSRMPAEGMKSPASERLRSLRRILSRGSLSNRVGTSCSSPRAPDIEQGTPPGSAMATQKNSQSVSYS